MMSPQTSHAHDLTGRTVLVLGGTRYVGRRLVERLVAAGADVTIATRGLREDRFGDSVERIVLDRADHASMSRALGGRSWDVVYDQICYAPSDAADVCDLFAGLIGRYVLISSQMVYEPGEGRREEEFDPVHAPVRLGRRPDFTYDEGKRLAEAVLAQCAPFPVVTVRMPVILAEDDYTGRLRSIAERIVEGREVRVPAPGAAMSLISADEATDVLFRLGGIEHVGPVNAASEGALTSAELVAMLVAGSGRAAHMSDEMEDDPFALTAPLRSLTLDTALARDLDLPLRSLGDWLPQLAAGTMRQAAEGR